MSIAKNLVGKMMNQYWCADKELDVSVVIPAYNEGSGDYLNKAIDSALKYKAEVIVVDDGSTDKTSTIARDYESKGNDVRVDSVMEDGLLDDVVRSVRNGYVGGTARSEPDSYGASETAIFDIGNIFSDISTKFQKISGYKGSFCTDGGFLYCRSDIMKAIESRYGKFFQDGKSQDKFAAQTMTEFGMIDRITDNGVETSARRIRHDGFARTVFDKLKRYGSGPGQPYAPDIREDAALAA